MSNRPASIIALEAFNVSICAATGAGRGHETMQEARAAYAAMLASRAIEARQLIAAARGDATRINRHFVDGMESALARAIEVHGEPVTLANIKPDSAYMTAGRDYSRASGYEFLIGAYEITPSQVALDGEAFPVTLARQGGFKSNAAAKRAGSIAAKGLGL